MCGAVLSGADWSQHRKDGPLINNRGSSHPRATYTSARTRSDIAGRRRTSVKVWVRQADIDDGLVGGVTTADKQRISELEQENKELRRANAILKSASAFFAAELDRPQR